MKFDCNPARQQTNKVHIAFLQAVDAEKKIEDWNGGEGWKLFVIVS